MNDTLDKEIAATFEDLVKVYSSFKKSDIDQVPFNGSWSPGQVAEHIIKSLSDITSFFNSNIAPTVNRPFDARVAELGSLFLDFSTKMQSPAFILPGASTHDQSDQLNQFSEIQKEMQTAATTLDLTLTCNSFEMPGFGFLTRYEWLKFYIFHTRRHTHQLKNIFNAVNS